MRSTRGAKKEIEAEALRQIRIGELYAAEASFLHAMGWKPRVIGGVVLWQNPRNPLKDEFQPTAVITAKEQADGIVDPQSILKVRHAIARLLMVGEKRA